MKAKVKVMQDWSEAESKRGRKYYHTVCYLHDEGARYEHVYARLSAFTDTRPSVAVGSYVDAVLTEYSRERKMFRLP